MPADMLGLIEQYEYGLKYRIYEVVNWLNAEGLLESGNQPDYIHPVADVDIMAPIQYPSKVMNAAVNFIRMPVKAAPPNSWPSVRGTSGKQGVLSVPQANPWRIVGDGEDIANPSAGMKLSMKWKWPSIRQGG